MSPPHDLRFTSNGLSHHALAWRGGAEGGASTPLAVIVHGFQDAAATWDDVAVPLAEAGLLVVAPDMRGFGDGARVPPGGYYYFPDYVADVAALLTEHASGRPLYLIGHSMGATVVSYVAGAFPERVTRLALIDGVGPIDNPFDVAPIRMRRWVDETALADAPPPRKPMTRGDALARLVRYNPDVDEAVLERRVDQLAREVDGGLEWKTDPLHSSMSPLPFFAETYKAFARRVTCPTVHVSGGAKGHHVPDEEERLACFAALTRVTIEGGHGLHWSKPRELAAALVAFWRG